MAVSMDKFHQDFQIYNGLTDPNEFFRKFEIYAFVNGWEEIKQPEALKLFVRGKAEQAYDAAFVANKKTYKELKIEITNACQLTKEQRLKMFYERKMHDGESVRDYAQVLNSLLKKAVPNLDVTDMSALVQGQLVNNVPAELKPMMTIASALGATHFSTVINTMCAQTDQLIMDLGLVKHEHSELNYTQVNRRNFNNNNNASSRSNVQKK
jgi:hypothetical protein